MAALDFEDVAEYSSSSIRMPSKNPVNGSRSTDLYISYMKNKHDIPLKPTSSTFPQQKYVIKTWRALSKMSGAARNSFKTVINTELKNWKNASVHAHIGPILGLGPDIRELLYDEKIAEQESIPSIIVPYYRSGNSVEYLKQNKGDPIPILIGTADAIRFLHNLTPPIIHTKIKGSNIMISDEGKPMLTDIGMGKLHHPSSGQNLNDVRWMPPEFIDLLPVIQSLPSSTASDVYSFSMTILELFTLSHPYVNRRVSAQVILDIYTGIIPPRPPNCEDLTDPIWDMTTKCWNRDPKQRPDIGVVSGILEIEYFMAQGRKSW